jgi:hypothetical protein
MIAFKLGKHSKKTLKHKEFIRMTEQKWWGLAAL